MPRMRQRLISAPVNIVLPVPVWPEDDRVVAGVGEPIQDDRRATRPRPPVQVTARLVQVGGRMEEARGEAGRIEVALGERPGCRTRQGRPPGVGEPERRDLEVEPETATLEAEQFDPLPKRRGLGRLEQQDRVDEVDPSAARLDRASGGGRGVAHPLAFDVDELAPLRGQAVGRSDLAEADGHERHRLAAPERPDPHRDRGDALDRQETGQPAGFHLGRPATRGREGGGQAVAADERGGHAMLRAGAPHRRPERAELVRPDLAGDDAPFLGDPGETRHDPPKLGLARRVEEEVRPPERPARRRGDLAVQRRVRGERSDDPLALDPLLHGGEVLAGVPLGRDREELERSRDRVVERGERLEGRLALDLGHELEVHRRELEAGDEAALDRQAGLGHPGDRPGHRRGSGADGAGSPRFRAPQEGDHGAADAGGCAGSRAR